MPASGRMFLPRTRSEPQRAGTNATALGIPFQASSSPPARASARRAGAGPHDAAHDRIELGRRPAATSRAVDVSADDGIRSIIAHCSAGVGGTVRGGDGARLLDRGLEGRAPLGIGAQLPERPLAGHGETARWAPSAPPSPTARRARWPRPRTSTPSTSRRRAADGADTVTQRTGVVWTIRLGLSRYASNRPMLPAATTRPNRSRSASMCSIPFSSGTTTPAADRDAVEGGAAPAP